jgi:hypothetical protein
MKFLEVKLWYMNTNLVQENFSRSAQHCPAGGPHFLPVQSLSIHQGACCEPFW